MVPLWFMRIMAMSSHLFREQAAAGSPCTDVVPHQSLFFFRLGFQNPVLPPHGVCRPCTHELVVQQQHVEVIGIRQLAQLIDLLRGFAPPWRVVTFDISR